MRVNTARGSGTSLVLVGPIQGFLFTNRRLWRWNKEHLVDAVNTLYTDLIKTMRGKVKMK